MMLVVQIRSKIPAFARRRFDAEDVLQEAFFNACREIQSFEYRGEGSFRSWLATIVFHEFRNQLRARRVERAHLPTQVVSDSAEALPDEDEVRRASSMLSRDELYEKLGELQDEDREVISMRVFEGLSWGAIGAVLDCGKDQAQAAYERAVGRLQRLLSG